MSTEKRKVFISSILNTSLEDLREERRVVREVVSSFSMLSPWAFEKAPASFEDLDESCLRNADECDILIVVTHSDDSPILLRPISIMPLYAMRQVVVVSAGFTDADGREFQASYSRVSQWAKRHDKSGMVNYVAPGIKSLEKEPKLVEEWFKRVKAYKN
jgi:hypothetical protein